MASGFIISDKINKYKGAIKQGLKSYVLHFSPNADITNFVIQSGNLAFIAFDLQGSHINFHALFYKINSLYGKIPTFLITDSFSSHEDPFLIEKYIGYTIDKVFFLDKDISTFIETINSLPLINAQTPGKIRKIYRRIIGVSKNMEELRLFISRAARNDLPVILCGDTGCGKTASAELIYETSSRKNKEFVLVDLGVIKEELVESTLFGAKKGAFTGAYENLKGLIENSKDGVLFLDELENASLFIQMKLLRVLDSKKFRAVGGTREENIDFRLICATNKSLRTMIKENTLRQDLYYRIYGQVFRILPLSERKEDIPVLVEYYCKKHDFEIIDKTIEKLLLHNWKGNVRELFTIMNRAFINAAPLKVILPEHIRLIG